MMAAMTKLHRIALLALALLVSACTEPLGSQGLTQSGASNLPAGPLIQVSAVQFGGQNTAAQQMQVSNGTLYLTGTPFMFAEWNISTDPENPIETFAATNNVLAFSPDPPFGGWVVTEFGAGALSIFGNFALTSGSYGSSVIEIGPSAQQAQEIARYPMLDANGDQPADVSFAFTAAVGIPGSNAMFGFTQQDGAYLINVSNPTGLNQARVSLTPYSGSGPTCCAVGATFFNSMIYLAMRSGVWPLTVSTSGVLSRTTVPGLISTLQPVNIFATSRYIYVHHEPTSNGNTSSPAGIYVFDAYGNTVSYFPIQPLAFAVSPDDSHIYSNEDDVSVKIYRWTNSSLPVTGYPH